MKAFTSILIAAVVLGFSLVARPSVAQDTYTLISEEEFSAELKAPEDQFFERAHLDPEGPVIGLIRPGEGSKFKAPIDIELKFEAADGAEIDLGTLKITYGSLGIDVTERVTEHATITETGLVSENAELPAGRHKLTVTISDTAGRVGRKRFKFEIAK
jgi:hypothetical protein